MKHRIKPILLCAFFLIFCMTVLGCGGTAETSIPEADTTSEAPASESLPDTTEHTHAFSQAPVNTVPATCAAEGYEEYRCEDCGELDRTPLALKAHQPVTRYDIALGQKITECSVCGNGMQAEPFDVILELTAASASAKTPYADFYVYVRTSDPSGKYFVRYIFDHAYNTTKTGGANYQNNANLFRINTAQLVEVRAINESAVSYTTVCGLLTSGEIAFAFRENGAADSVGGYHGDENLLSLALFVDGMPHDDPGKQNKVVTCLELALELETMINRCNTPGNNIVKHTQFYEIDKNGIRCSREVEWLTGDVTFASSVAGASLQMFTMRRIDGDKTVCEIVEVFDKDGNSLGKEVQEPIKVTSEHGIFDSKNGRHVKHSSADSGICAEASFEIVDNSCLVGGTFVNVRASDNKWYARFISPTSGKTPAKGEIWKVNTYYNIDYIAP